MEPAGRATPKQGENMTSYRLEIVGGPITYDGYLYDNHGRCIRSILKASSPNVIRIEALDYAKDHNRADRNERPIYPPSMHFETIDV
jgi:hypothetical protein